MVSWRGTMRACVWWFWCCAPLSLMKCCSGPLQQLPSSSSVTPPTQTGNMNITQHSFPLHPSSPSLYIYLCTQRVRLSPSSHTHFLRDNMCSWLYMRQHPALKVGLLEVYAAKLLCTQPSHRWDVRPGTLRPYLHPYCVHGCVRVGNSMRIMTFNMGVAHPMNHKSMLQQLQVAPILLLICAGNELLSPSHHTFLPVV